MGGFTNYLLRDAPEPHQPFRRPARGGGFALARYIGHRFANFADYHGSMKDEILQPYPGTNASPEEIFALAAEYHSAADALIPKGRPREPISRAPARLCAIQAIDTNPLNH